MLNKTHDTRVLRSFSEGGGHKGGVRREARGVWREV
jgi:hypothetical protein